MRDHIVNRRLDKSFVGKTVVTKFFDLYALHELYFRLAGGMEDYGYQRYIFVSGALEDKIRHKYEHAVEEMSAAVNDALLRSVRSESRYIPSRLIKKGKKTLSDIERGFNAMGKGAWGGPKWAKAVSWLIKSLNAKTLNDKMYCIDAIFDLQHNNGFILNKTEFYELDIRIFFKRTHTYRKALNIRANAKSILDYVPYCSRRVKNYILANATKL